MVIRFGIVASAWNKQNTQKTYSVVLKDETDWKERPSTFVT
ncbi:MAG TPA: hypothetical protein VIT44_01800 [Cyclobacteriaceae bacterium]